MGDNADVFPNDATETVDSDGDGVGDNTDVFPNDAKETIDSDGDGVGDNADAYPNDPERSEDDTAIYDISFTSETTLLNATVPGDQINPSIAALPGNQFVMTWSDRAGNDGDRGGIFGRLYDETMTPLTSEFVVNTLTADWQSKSNVASAPNGTFMAIWHQSNGYVEGQLFNSSGDKRGSQFTVQEGFNGLSDVVADASGDFWVVSSVNNGSGYVSKYSNTGELLVDSLVLPSEGVASEPVITALADGRILVSWHDGQNRLGSEIFGQFITADGVLSGEPFVVNTTLAENQSKPAIVALTSGGFVVAWQSLLQDGDLAGVYARVLDVAGEGGSEILVNENTAGNQVRAYVTARSDGGFVVGWADAAAPPQGQVYLQSYTAGGELQGDNQVVSVDDVTTINNSVNIELTELTDGSLVAVWNAWNGSQNIYGRTLEILIKQEPTPPREIGSTSPTSVLNATLPGDQINPSIAALPDNQFVLTWSDRASLDGDRGGILGRLYDETMTPLTSEFLVNTLTGDWQSKSNVASAPNGTFMAIWHEANGWVEGQLFTVSGEKQGPQFTVQDGFNGLSDVVADAQGNFWVVSSVNNGAGYVNKYSNAGELLVDSLVLPSVGVASDPVITALANDSILVSWYDGQNPSGSDIYAQFITAEGLLSGTPFVINTTIAENQSKPAVAAMTSGGFVVTWQSLLQDGDLAGVYARVFDAAGEGGSEILVNTSTTGNQVQAYVTARSDGGFIVGWADAAAPPQGQVYLQSYTADGEPQGDNQLVSVDDVTTINNSVNIELTELTDGSLVAVWNAWKGSQNIYGRTFKLLTITETDSDGDGVVDTVDAFPSDPNEWADYDEDGVGDNADTDDDNDGLADTIDLCPRQNGLLEASGNDDTLLDIARFEFCTAIVDGVPTMQFTIELSSNFTGDSLQLLFWLEGEDQTWITINRDPDTGLFTRSLTLHPQAAGGIYAVRAVRLFDQDGLEVRLNEGQLNELGIDTKSELINPNEDTAPPQLDSFISDGWKIGEDGIPRLDVDLVASDVGSGLQSRVIVELISPSGAGIQKDAYFDEAGTATVTFEISQYSASGDYRVNTVRIYDEAGNKTFSQDWLSQNPQVFTLDNPQSDSASATLTDFNLSASFDNDSDRPVINVSGVATDDVAGVESVYLRLNRPGGGNIDKWLAERQSSLTLEFARNIALTTQFTPGEYSVNYLRLQDAAKNESTLGASEIDAIIEGASSINVYFPSEDAVTGGKTYVEGTSKDDYVFGSNASDDTLVSGSGDDEIYSGDGHDEVDAGDGDDIIVGGSGRGNDIYRGGSGFDSVVYASATAPIVVDLKRGLADGSQIGTDQLSSIEAVLGGQNADVLRGDSSSNELLGGAGDDFLFGTAGADRLDGEIGSDSYVYSAAIQSDLTGYDTVRFDADDRVILDSVLINSLSTVSVEVVAESISEAVGALSGSQDYQDKVVYLTWQDASASDQLSSWLLVNTSVDDALNGLLLKLDGAGQLSSEIQVLEDTDSDGLPNLLALDDDGDGIADDEDVFPTDSSETLDTDGDGVGDNADVFPSNSSETEDSDSDGVGNNADTDDDGDGYLDTEEIAAGSDPLSSDSVPSETDESAGGLPIWMLYIATQPVDSQKIRY